MKRFGGFCDDMREAVMTKDEMQVLRALELGLASLEAELACAEDAYPLVQWRVDTAKKEVQQLRDAIEVVERWETKE